MTVILAFVVGVLFAGGIYAMMQRSVVKLIIGLALLGYSVNLMIFIIGRLTRAVAPIIPTGQTTLEPPYADPVPQALILTAIVIGFGLHAFALVLVKRVYVLTGSNDADDLTTTDK